MGVVVSKKNRDRTKKVQQTAAVVSALKTASKNTDSPSSKRFGSAGLPDSNKVAPLEEKRFDYASYCKERDENSLEGLNVDRSSMTYGLPELKGDINDVSRSGSTGYWDEDSATVTIPYFGAWNNRVENDELCSVCGVYTGMEIHPCRVCCKVFHENCLKKQGKLHGQDELEAFRRASIGSGWSCSNCENLPSLLTDEEMQDLIESFDRLDVNQDTIITQEEYVRFNQAQYKDAQGEEMPVYMVEEAQNEFKMIDKDHTGTIDWWEFLNHESLKVLGMKRSKFQLVRMLSPREIERTRDIFHAFDRDEDGYINSYEVSKGFGRWFGNLRVSDSGTSGTSGSFGRALNSRDVAGHVDRHTSIFMHADTDNNRLVSWDEYLREQALYVLAARPNHPPTNS